MTATSPVRDVWAALLGAPRDQPVPADSGLWEAIKDRLNPARARPVARAGIERVDLTTVHGTAYAMLRSPDDVASYVRLSAAEADLALGLDGSRTVAQLVGDFARATGTLAPERVRRVVADLAAARMLEELPVDAFASLDARRTRPAPVRLGRAMARAAAGQRYVLLDPDRVVGALHRAGGRLAFSRVGVAVLALIGLVGFGLWVRTWAGGAVPATLVGGSYATGALALLGLNVVGLLVHELGHALAAKHAGRRVPAAGFLLYFGIPTAFVDTTDAWMASRRDRLRVTAAGPGFTIALAGAMQVAAVIEPGLRPLAFPLGLAWYLNSLFNLNPLMALDGYYLLADWLEIPNLRPRATAFLVGCVRRPTTLLQRRAGEDRLIAGYAALSALWLVVFAAVTVRLHRDRFSGVWSGLWHRGWGNRVVALAIVGVLLSPAVHALSRRISRTASLAVERQGARRLDADRPRRLAALRRSELGGLTHEQLDALAATARWVRPRRGADVVAEGAALPGAIVVVDGALEARRREDAAGAIRARAEPGEVVGLYNVLHDTPASLTWRAAGTRLLVLPHSTINQTLPQPAVPATDRDEVEAAIAASPFLHGMPVEQTELIASHATLTEATPGQAFTLRGPHAALVGSGTLDVSGQPVGPGTVLGPGGDDPIPIVSRTKTRLWSFPVEGLVAGLAGGALPPAGTGVAWAAPSSGAHGDGGPPPPAWGPPPLPDDGDDQLGRRLRQLVALALLLAILTWLLALRPPMLWAETPDDAVTLEIRRGTAEAWLGGDHLHLERGQRVLLRRGDRVDVHRRSTAALVYRGGAEVLLCAQSDAAVDRVAASGTEPVAPAGALTVTRGAAIADTGSETFAFAPLALEIRAGGHHITSTGEARFMATGAGVLVQVGAVTLDGTLVPEDPAARLGCGTGTGGASDGSGSTAGPVASEGAPAETTTTTEGAPDDPAGNDGADPDEPADSGQPPATTAPPTGSTTVPTTLVPPVVTTAPTTTTSTSAAAPRPLLRVSLVIGSCPARAGGTYTCSGNAQFVFGAGGATSVGWSLGGTLLVSTPRTGSCSASPFSQPQTGFSVAGGGSTLIVDRAVSLSFSSQPARAADGSPTSTADLVVVGSPATDSALFGDATCLG